MMIGSQKKVFRDVAIIDLPSNALTLVQIVPTINISIISVTCQSFEISIHVDRGMLCHMKNDRGMLCHMRNWDRTQNNADF